MSVLNCHRFPVEVILLCVRWHCKYGISYRDLAEMMQERGVTVDSATIFDGCSAMRPESRSRFVGEVRFVNKLFSLLAQLTWLKRAHQELMQRA